MTLVHQITDSAWLAGLFDGEAFIGVVLLKNSTYSEGRYWAPKIRLHMTHEQTVLKVAGLCGGNVSTDKTRLDTNQSWGWDCPRANMIDVLESIQPYSVTKKKAVDLLWAFLQYRAMTSISDRRSSGTEDEIAYELRALTASTRQIRERKRSASYG